jgi:phosphoribosylformylglycinamidine synthase
MRARVTVRLKHGVLDPQGEAIGAALTGLGFDGVRDVRVGKIIELDVDGEGAELQAKLATMSDQLLANPVIETYTVELLPAERAP